MIKGLSVHTEILNIFYSLYLFLIKNFGRYLIWFLKYKIGTKLNRNLNIMIINNFKNYSNKIILN